MWCKSCRVTGYTHCAHPDECGNMVTLTAAADSWKSWLDDAPLPETFNSATGGLQDFITALSRALLDARAELARVKADAAAAMALVVERAAENKEQLDIWAQEILEGLSFADVLKITSYDDKIEAHNIVGRGLVDVIRTLAPADALAEVKAQAERKVGELLDQLDAELARHGGPWLLGQNYSALDPYALMLCRWTRGFASNPARVRPHLGPYLQAMLARPAVQRVFTAEKLPQPWV